MYVMKARKAPQVTKINYLLPPPPFVVALINSFFYIKIKEYFGSVEILVEIMYELKELSTGSSNKINTHRPPFVVALINYFLC